MHNDRIYFTKNMICNISLEEVIKNYFDEIMTLYDLVGTYDNFSIEGNFKDNLNIYFNLVFNDKKDAEILYNFINNITISKYNRIFNCNVQHNDNILCITLQ